MQRLVLLIFAGMIIGCGPDSDQNNDNGQDVKAFQTKWEIIGMDGDEIRADRPVYIDLSEDQKVSGFAGCNRVMGSYEISSGNKVQFENLATTRMACPNLDLENKILKLLDSANHFKIENETAYLSRGEGPVLIELRRMEDSDIVNKYWKLKSLGGQPVVMAENQEREQFFMLRGDETVSGFSGCNHFNGQYKLAGEKKMKFNENMAVSLKACLDMDVDERRFLDVFPAADRYIDEGDHLILLDDSGEELATFEAVYF